MINNLTQDSNYTQSRMTENSAAQMSPPSAHRWSDITLFWRHWFILQHTAVHFSHLVLAWAADGMWNSHIKIFQSSHLVVGEACREGQCEDPGGCRKTHTVLLQSFMNSSGFQTKFMETSECSLQDTWIVVTRSVKLGNVLAQVKNVQVWPSGGATCLGLVLVWGSCTRGGITYKVEQMVIRLAVPPDIPAAWGPSRVINILQATSWYLLI